MLLLDVGFGCAKAEVEEGEHPNVHHRDSATEECHLVGVAAYFLSSLHEEVNTISKSPESCLRIRLFALPDEH